MLHVEIFMHLHYRFPVRIYVHNKHNYNIESCSTIYSLFENRLSIIVRTGSFNSIPGF